MLTLLEYVSNETCSSALAGTTVTGKQYKDLILSDFLLQRYNQQQQHHQQYILLSGNITYSYIFLLQRNSSHQI